jgi:hypothetical protein
LDSLLAEKRMLLVVDDVWNAAHADWFRVGGASCRVLVTTREAQIEGADNYPLDLMSEAEAVDLVRQKLEQQWSEAQEAEVKAFAKLLGYLPLALDLAANQVRDGLSWADLRTEFEAERRAVAVAVLDSPEAWELLEEKDQRRYSLRACFNLSLKRLQPKQLQQFAWLGVLPEDVSLEARVAAVLWAVPLLQAKKGLIDLRRRSFLTDGVATSGGELTYRVHDLMHDMARGLITASACSEAGTLPGLGCTLAQAHRQFLERYRERAVDQRWNRLPNDGYIHRHLTWHMEQADWTDEIHVLMSMSDERGRNAWFEACDRIGQPAIFVEDVTRGWKLAEQVYEPGNAKAIVLQCRYALMQATLNSLISNLPIGMMAEFVKRNFWPVAQAWAYVEQMQDESKVAEAIQALAPYLSKSLFQIAVGKARAIQDEYKQADVLIELAKLDSSDFSALLEAARAIQDEDSRARVLSELAKLDSVYFAEALKAARAIQDEFMRGDVLSELIKLDSADFSALSEAARKIQDESIRAKILSELAKLDTVWLPDALKAVRKSPFGYSRVSALSTLAKLDTAYFSEALEVTRTIQDEYWRALTLNKLAKLNSVYFSEALEAARAVQGKRISNPIDR